MDGELEIIPQDPQGEGKLGASVETGRVLVGLE